MTTVCYDGKKLVTDGQATVGDNFIATTKAKKIHTPGEGEYWDYNGVRVLAFGSAGDSTSIVYVKEALSEGLTHKTLIDASSYLAFDFLLVLETGDAVVFSGYLDKGNQVYHSFPVEVPVAIGSGTPFATSVMESNKSDQAVKGVKAGIKFDAWSGGDLQIWELPPIPEVPSKRPTTVVEGVLYEKPN